MVAIPLIAKSATLEAILIAREAAQKPRLSRRLGGSEIGDDCDRKLWYGFRWALPPQRFSGQLLRLFQTGHVEEDRMLADLRSAGVSVFAEQAIATLCGGHFVAKIDAIASGLIEAPKTWHLVECKTHNDDSFRAVKRDGVQVSKPLHFSQMQSYMHAHGLDRALYMAVNKNTDELHLERVSYDGEYALRLIIKAERVIAADRAPPRVSPTPDYFGCNFCRYAGICHHNQWAQRTCRSCLHATAHLDGSDGVWSCARHQKTLTQAEQERGCGDHRFLPDLVPGEQIDLDGDLITYRLADGLLWVDGGENA